MFRVFIDLLVITPLIYILSAEGSAQLNSEAVIRC